MTSRTHHFGGGGSATTMWSHVPVGGSAGVHLCPCSEPGGMCRQHRAVTCMYGWGRVRGSQVNALSTRSVKSSLPTSARSAL